MHGMEGKMLVGMSSTTEGFLSWLILEMKGSWNKKAFRLSSFCMNEWKKNEPLDFFSQTNFL